MLERNPGLLGSHSNNFSVYTERVTALAQWAPPTLDLNKVLALWGPTQLHACLCCMMCAVRQPSVPFHGSAPTLQHYVAGTAPAMAAWCLPPFCKKFT